MNNVLSFPVIKNGDKKRVVIYARVSTKEGNQDTSYELQINELAKAILLNPKYELICVYADKESGTNANERPAFMKMMKFARLGGIDIIYTKSVSRFGRNAIEVPTFIRELRNLGVEVFFDKENISSASLGDEFILNILSSVAEEESRQISSNMQWIITKKMSKGKNTTVRIYGYMIIGGEFIIVPEEANVVRLLFKWYLEKISYTNMIANLHKMNIKSPSGNEFWSRTTIEQILINEKYCGDSLLGRNNNFKTRKNKKFLFEERNKFLVTYNHQGIISRDIYACTK